MSQRTQRRFARNHYDALVRYTIPLTGDYGVARASNLSRGGMRFRTFHPLATGNAIEIVLANPSRKASEPKTYVGYLAQIRWCLELPAPLLENFDVGTHFLEERQAFEHYPLPDEAHACDLCGVNVAMECACYFEGAVCLCPSCHKYLARITDGAVKDGIRKFLVGNVL